MKLPIASLGAFCLVLGLDLVLSPSALSKFETEQPTKPKTTTQLVVNNSAAQQLYALHNGAVPNNAMLLLIQGSTSADCPSSSFSAPSLGVYAHEETKSQVASAQHGIWQHTLRVAVRLDNLAAFAKSPLPSYSFCGANITLDVQQIEDLNTFLNKTLN